LLTEWSGLNWIHITDFLNECEVKLFRDKIGCYLTSLETIIDSREDTERYKRAQFLHDLFKRNYSCNKIRTIKFKIFATDC